jgi:hypothetical protein
MVGTSALALAMSTPSSRAQGPTPPAFAATRCETPPVIDGRLDDEVWQLARAIDAFVQVDPREGEAPTEHTAVRALFDADHLYIAVRCDDREPNGIIGTQMKRDADLETDDRVQIAIDTFEDHRNGFFFAMNPVGAKVDALIANNGEVINQAWDGIWEGRASIDATGWSVELAIPFKTLTFNAALASWGFNVQRVIKRRLEEDRWASPRRNYSVYQVSEAGTLTGLTGINQGIGLDVVPFFAAHWDDDGTDSHLTGVPGFDAFYHLTPSLGLDLTVNTDFAETEVDQRQINLTRFPLFFPEKRDFFLADAGIFQFADLGHELVPFFSRRIGLNDSGQEIPIEVGLKMTGRAGDYNIGVLDVQTDSAHGFDAANLFVTRVSKNIGEQSTVGAIFTHGDPNGRDTNSLAGVDANFGTSEFMGDRNLRASVWALESFDDSQTDDASAFGASLSYPNDIWSWSIAAKQIDTDFDPALGFVPRTGIRQYNGELQYEPILNRDVRRLEFGFDPLLVTDLDDRVESVDLTTKLLGIVWDAGDELRVLAAPQYESLDQPFDIQPNVTIPRGDYDWLRWRVEAESALKRPISGGIGVEAGDFFDGTRTDVMAELDWRPSRYFTGGLGYVQNDVSLPGGDFVTQLGNLRADIAFSPDLTWSNFLQVDNETDTLGWNSRWQWIVTPGEVFAIVYNSVYERSDGAVQTQSQGAVFKAQYTLRL